MKPTDFCPLAPDGQEPDDERLWLALLLWLLPNVTAWVRDAHVATWRKQQREIAEDIAHEALARTFICVQRARHNEGPPVICLKPFCYRVAKHLFLDRLRKEWRLVHLTSGNDVDRTYSIKGEQPDAAELAVDHLIDEEVIINAVKVIVKLPDKRRAALLTALANAVDLTGPPSLLERELAKQGIQLRDYVRPRPDDPAARSRQAALLWYALRALQRLKDNS